MSEVQQAGSDLSHLITEAGMLRTAYDMRRKLKTGIQSLALIERGLLAGSSLDEKIRIWNVKQKSEGRMCNMRGHSGVILNLTPVDRGLLASSSTD